MLGWFGGDRRRSTTRRRRQRDQQQTQQLKTLGAMDGCTSRTSGASRTCGAGAALSLRHVLMFLIFLPSGTKVRTNSMYACFVAARR